VGAQETRSNAPGRCRGGQEDKKKVCQFCKEKAIYVDYKDVAGLRRYMSERGKIRARRVTGCCAEHQRDVRHRRQEQRSEMALLPYISGGR